MCALSSPAIDWLGQAFFIARFSLAAIAPLLFNRVLSLAQVDNVLGPMTQVQLLSWEGNYWVDKSLPSHQPFLVAVYVFLWNAGHAFVTISHAERTHTTALQSLPCF